MTSSFNSRMKSTLNRPNATAGTDDLKRNFVNLDYGISEMPFD